MEKNSSELIIGARKFLRGKVATTSANEPFLLYILEDPALADFKSLLLSEEPNKEDSKTLLKIYLKRLNALTKKVLVLAEIIGITDYEELSCFIVDTTFREDCFATFENLDIEHIKSYVQKVKEGMNYKDAIKELGLPPDITVYNIIRESFDTDD